MVVMSCLAVPNRRNYTGEDDVTMGVPQRSIMGPILLNTMYDQIFNLAIMPTVAMMMRYGAGCRSQTQGGGVAVVNSSNDHKPEMTSFPNQPSDIWGYCYAKGWRNLNLKEHIEDVRRRADNVSKAFTRFMPYVGGHKPAS